MDKDLNGRLQTILRTKFIVPEASFRQRIILVNHFLECLNTNLRASDAKFRELIHELSFKEEIHKDFEVVEDDEFKFQFMLKPPVHAFRVEVSDTDGAQAVYKSVSRASLPMTWINFLSRDVLDARKVYEWFSQSIESGTKSVIEAGKGKFMGHQCTMEKSYPEIKILIWDFDSSLTLRISFGVPCSNWPPFSWSPDLWPSLQVVKGKKPLLRAEIDRDINILHVSYWRLLPRKETGYKWGFSVRKLEDKILGLDTKSSALYVAGADCKMDILQLTKYFRQFQNLKAAFSQYFVRIIILSMCKDNQDWSVQNTGAKWIDFLERLKSTLQTGFLVHPISTNIIEETSNYTARTEAMDKIQQMLNDFESNSPSIDEYFKPVESEISKTLDNGYESNQGNAEEEESEIYDTRL